MTSKDKKIKKPGQPKKDVATTPDFTLLVEQLEQDKKKAEWEKRQEKKRQKERDRKKPLKNPRQPKTWEQAKPLVLEGELLEPLEDTRDKSKRENEKLEQQLLVLADGVRHGLSVPEIVKKYDISTSAAYSYLREVREEVAINSQMLDLQLVGALEGKIIEILKNLPLTKIKNTSIKDLAIATGIFLDKRKDLLGPKKEVGGFKLRAAFKSEGAVKGAIEISSSD